MLCLEEAKGVAMEALTIGANRLNTFTAKSTTPSSNLASKEMSLASVKSEIKSDISSLNTQDDNKLDPKKMQEVEQKLNKMASLNDVSVKFAYNEKLNMSYISIIDKETGEEIRKLPSEEAMKISESMKELIGVMFDKKG